MKTMKTMENMENKPKIKMYSFTLDCKQPVKLGKFYAALLGWEVGFIDEEYAWVNPPGTQQGAYPCILLQRSPEYEPPVWPQKPGAQQQMAHIDFAVDDLEKAVQYAVLTGARIADDQFSENWTVMFDPEGHPFCLCQMKAVIQSAHFALL